MGFMDFESSLKSFKQDYTPCSHSIRARGAPCSSPSRPEFLLQPTFARQMEPESCPHSFPSERPNEIPRASRPALAVPAPSLRFPHRYVFPIYRFLLLIVYVIELRITRSFKRGP